MPDTITAYNSFTARTIIESAKVNENFSNHRGNLLPINSDTATASDATHDLGNTSHRWRNAFFSDGVQMTSLSATSQTTPTSGVYHVWNKESVLVARRSDGVDFPLGPGSAWKKYSLSIGAFQTAALTNTGTLFNANPKEMILGAFLKHSTNFTSTSGSITSLTIKLGLSTDRTRYLDAFTLSSALSATAYASAQLFDLPSFDTTTPVTWMVEAAGGNLSALTQGQVDVWVLTSILP